MEAVQCYSVVSRGLVLDKVGEMNIGAENLPCQVYSVTFPSQVHNNNLPYQVHSDSLLYPVQSDNLPYQVHSVLGKGGFGTVYAGVRTSDGLTVAIKEVPANKVLDWSYLGGRSVPLELNLLYSCQSVPGVVRLIDFYDRGDYFLYIMERPVNSRDLFDFISQNRTLGEERARNLFKQVVDTVIECYERGVVHRDIKDENLIVDMDTVRLKLIDFGSGAFVKSEPFHDYDGGWKANLKSIK